MDASTANVMAEWFDLCHRIGVGLGPANAMGETLLAAYTEPHRRYHTLDHVHTCLRSAHDMPLDDDVRTVVELALWFHDVIYEPTAPDNEHRSAVLAASWITDHIDSSGTLAASVAGVIEMTAGHELAPDADIADKVVHDIDLQILGADAEGYDDYAALIRAEYRHLSDADFREGRARVLTSMLAVDPLFALPGYREHVEPVARRNMARELDQLMVES